MKEAKSLPLAAFLLLKDKNEKLLTVFGHQRRQNLNGPSLSLWNQAGLCDRERLSEAVEARKAQVLRRGSGWRTLLMDLIGDGSNVGPRGGRSSEGG